MVSSTDFANSLDVPGAASEHYTLAVMTVVALIALPVVLLYQGWSYYVFRARVTGEDVELPEAVASPVERVARGLTVRILDKRLVRRARPVRRLLGAGHGRRDASAALVLLQAILIGRIVAQAFAGAGLARRVLGSRAARAHVRGAER